MKKLTLHEFIVRSNKKHNFKYDYSKVNFKDSRTKVKIICPDHGEFEQLPTNHFLRSGCPKCANVYRMSFNEFVLNANNIHNNKYTYIFNNKFSLRNKVKIICSKHGTFEQVAFKHLQGNSCPICNGGIKFTNDIFIQKAKEVHGDKYDYSKVDYVNSKINVKIICLEHGEFLQRPSSHLNGNGCPKCFASFYSSNYIKYDLKTLIFTFNQIHYNKYDYSKIVACKVKSKVCIICKKHGEFWQTILDHLRGSGCPKCNCSKGELRITKLLEDHNVNYVTQKKFEKLFGASNKIKLRFDFYLPDYNLCIEFDGIQHFKPIRFNGISVDKSKEVYLKTIMNDRLKNIYCNLNSIQIIRVTDMSLNLFVKNFHDILNLYSKL